ncbi:hypothetical protein EJ03DRAFT_354972 [Teratosphaeria nubilosa]|uniref:Uncharacterized protein n=1 Tax=Teratosphaeria nubilosa TaxID=161662 RepID=A0A6G1KXF8_9PEZI|nr:hypothetical protein EJ03DRAFT_354972 [Teratosphaeria nubilosa]
MKGSVSWRRRLGGRNTRLRVRPTTEGFTGPFTPAESSVTRLWAEQASKRWNSGHPRKLRTRPRKASPRPWRKKSWWTRMRRRDGEFLERFVRKLRRREEVTEVFEMRPRRHRSRERRERAKARSERRKGSGKRRGAYWWAF